MNQPHKHAAVIKAWADGAQIQHRWASTVIKPDVDNPWHDIAPDMGPGWVDYAEYRVKPKPKVKTYRWAFKDSMGNDAITHYFFENATQVCAHFGRAVLCTPLEWTMKEVEVV